MNIGLSSRLTLKIAEKIHFIPEYEKFEVLFGEVFISDHPVNWMEYGAGFRVTKLQPVKDTWTTENRLMLFADFSKTIEAFKLTFGNRFEYRNFRDLSDHFRYKQTFTCQFPKIAEWGMQFYVSEESFLRLDTGNLHLARFFGGLHALKTEHFQLSLYYGLQKAILRDDWYSSDIAGLNLQFTI